MKNTARLMAKKQLGQNFLIDPRLKEKIIAACDLQLTETVLEIGPGLGALTELIAPRVKKLIAIEKDQRLCQKLNENFSGTNVTIIPADFLAYPLENLPGKIKVIGNLPYYIASPIIEKIITHRKHICAFFITIQEELGQRLTAAINSKEYGAFTCFVQYSMDVAMCFKIKNTAFRPVPKVQSCFLKLTPRLQPRVLPRDEELFFKIIRRAFQQRRKILLNSLSPLLERAQMIQIFNSLNLNPQLRAENLTLENYASIANALSQIDEKGN